MTQSTWVAGQLDRVKMLFDTASSRATRITTLTTSAVSIRRQPKNLQELDLHLFASSSEYSAISSQMLELDGITAHANGWLYKKSTLLKDSFVDVRQPSRSRRLKSLPVHLMRARTAENISRSLWITDNWSRNYYHWLTDAMPRLYVATRSNADTEVLLPSLFEKIGYTRQSLEPFNLKGIRILKEKQCARVESLLLPTYVAHTGNYNDEIIREVGRLYREYFGAPTSLGRRIYISRSKAPVRKILNEHEILPILLQYGFEIYHCENLSFKEQVRLLSEASILTGPHGAGFVNMMFMQEGAKVLEIHPRDEKVNACYYSMASAFDHSYFYMLAETASSTLPSHLDNMIVDPVKLQEQLEAVCRD